jgi:signal peptidase I
VVVKHHHDTGAKETIISLLISFVMALVFRSYVIEAFVIPTGSMAPTLLGQHMLFHSAQTGYEWTVNPWNYGGRSRDMPFPVQGAGQNANTAIPVVTDPMTFSSHNIGRDPNATTFRGHPEGGSPKPIRAGDRILVQKYLYEIFEPKRFDVFVFKNPSLATQNYIKRLVGLPNEQVWIVDGDIFTRPVTFSAEDEPVPAGEWQIQRKPRRAQSSLWRPLFSSEFTPLDPKRNARVWFNDPWLAEGFDRPDRVSYRTESASASIEWDTERWPITDWNPYNEIPMQAHSPIYRLADLRVRAAIRPDTDQLTATATITSHNHEFRALIEPAQATLQMRPASADAPWQTLATHPSPVLRADSTTRVAFEHADQSLSLVVDGDVVLTTDYDWSPDQRLISATGKDAASFEGRTRRTNELLSPGTYLFANPHVRWTFEGSPVSLYRVGLDHDIYYRPTTDQLGRPGLGTHPQRVATMHADQFFALGDNSANSADSRAWTTVNPDYADQMFGISPDDETMSRGAYAKAIADVTGLVPRDMILGKAFFVYFPAPHTIGGRIPVPDTGRLRFIK